MATGLREYMRESCLAFKKQTEQKLVSRDTLRDLAIEAGYDEPDVNDILADLPALVSDKHFRV